MRGTEKILPAASGGLSGVIRRCHAAYRVAFRRRFAAADRKIKQTPPMAAIREGARRAVSGFRAVRYGIRWLFAMLFLLGFQLCRAAAPGVRRTWKRVKATAYQISRRLRQARAEIRLLRQRSRSAILIPMLTVTTVALTVCMLNMGVEVQVDGQSLGRVGSREEFLSVIHSVEEQASEYLGRPYVLDADVSYRLSLVDFKDKLDFDKASRLLFSHIDEITLSHVLRIDGKVVGANISRTAMELMLDRILDSYGPVGENGKLEFVQDVRLTEEPVSNTYLASIEDLEHMLTSPVGQTLDYVVQEGDTLSSIALRFNTSVDTITAINPGIQPSSLMQGQTLVASSTEPMLSVKELRQVTYTEEIPFEKEIRENNTMYLNKRKIVSKGVPGEKQIVAEVTLINGVEQSRQILSEQILSQPVTQIEHIGTKTPPPKSATGTFVRPCGGYVSSNYGYRGREFHTGVDFAGPIGSAIVASDGGTVVFSGNAGNGYGKYIIISHGNGVETLYAHCSSLLVSKGDKVGKGETIAKVGSTGRSTGPHCHFEVRINGKHVSPWKYIN